MPGKSPVSVSKDFEELFALLNARAVKGLIVGGYAFSYYAKPRYTQDIDILIEPRVEDLFGEQPVFFLGQEELIRNKTAVGRPKDREDVRVLKRFAQRKTP
jgi:hypothetical protein